MNTDLNNQGNHIESCNCEECIIEKEFLIDLICSSVTDEEEVAAVKGKMVTTLDMDDI